MLLYAWPGYYYCGQVNHFSVYKLLRSTFGLASNLAFYPSVIGKLITGLCGLLLKSSAYTYVQCRISYRIVS